MEAAQRYYELSLNAISSSLDKRSALQNAVICTLLAHPSNFYKKKRINFYKF